MGTVAIGSSRLNSFSWFACCLVMAANKEEMPAQSYTLRMTPQERRREMGPNEVEIRVTKVSMSAVDMLNVIRSPDAHGMVSAQLQPTITSTRPTATLSMVVPAWGLIELCFAISTCRRFFIG